MLKHRKIKFEYNRMTKIGKLSVEGREIRINLRKEAHNNSDSSGCGGYGIHLI